MPAETRLGTAGHRVVQDGSLDLEPSRHRDLLRHLLRTFDEAIALLCEHQAMDHGLHGLLAEAVVDWTWRWQMSIEAWNARPFQWLGSLVLLRVQGQSLQLLLPLR